MRKSVVESIGWISIGGFVAWTAISNIQANRAASKAYVAEEVDSLCVDIDNVGHDVKAIEDSTVDQTAEIDSLMHRVSELDGEECTCYACDTAGDDDDDAEELPKVSMEDKRKAMEGIGRGLAQSLKQ